MKIINKKTLLFFIILILSINFISAEKTISLIFTLDKEDNVNLSTVQVINANPILPINEGSYKIEFLSYYGIETFSTNFTANFFILTNPPTEVEEQTKIIRPIWINDTEKINIYNDNNLIKEIIISEHICNNNGICETEKGENHYNCPNDCFQETTTTTITTTTTTLQQDEEKGNNNLILYVIGSIIIIVLVLFLLFRKKEEDNNKGDYSEILNRLN